MAHYAFLDENNVVVEVITGKDENDLQDGVTDWETWYGNFRGKTCKRTSYNTHAGQHDLDGTPFRKNFARINGTYDEVRDAFIPPKQYASWQLDEDTCTWVSPVPYPQDGNFYQWNEELLNWEIVD